LTEALATLFEGHEIRILEKDGAVWMPCKDLGQALGLDRTTLYQHIKRNRDFFGETTIEGDILSHDGDDFWVNEQGLYLLLARVSVGRVQPLAKAAIIQFRKSVPALIQKYRKKELGPDLLTLEGQLQAELAWAKRIAEATGADLRPFQKIALQKCGLGDYAPALDQEPAIVHGEPGWYSPSELIPLYDDKFLTAERLNQFLNNHRDENREWKPYQYKADGIWRLTPLGLQYGREYLFRGRGGHMEPRIEWRIDILYASSLKKQVAPDQLALPSKAAV
jgi:prophage antirepressor-like protein